MEQAAAKRPLGVLAASDAVLLRRQTQPPLGIGENHRGHFLRIGELSVGANHSNADKRHLGFLLGFGLPSGGGRGVHGASATGRDQKKEGQ